MNKPKLLSLFFIPLLLCFSFDGEEQCASSILDNENDCGVELCEELETCVEISDIFENERTSTLPSSAVNSENLTSVGPFPCDPDFYHTYSGGTVGTYDFGNFSGGFNVVGSVGANVNATGYNPDDGFLYTIRRNDRHLIRIHNDGSFDDLGNMGGLPMSPVIGGFDPNGAYYVKDAGTSTIAIIDVNAASFTITNPSANFFAKDWAYHYSFGQFYGVNGSTLYGYNPVSNVVTTAPLTGILPADGSVYGAAFFAADNFIYVVNNVTGNIYRVDVENREAHFVLTGPAGVSSYDGDSCPGALPPFPVVCAHHDTVCTPAAGQVTFPILDNDVAYQTTLDFFSYTELIPPSFGTTSYNPSTGEVTYTATGTLQPDVFQYRICSNGPMLTCDYANIVIIPEPPITFDPLGPYCEGATPDALPGISIEGVSGTWSPATISTTSAGITDYFFTPDASLLCGQEQMISIAVEAFEYPTFPSYGPYCEGYSPDVLPGTSNEGIVGTWSPAVISTATVGTTSYTFTPDATLHPCGQQETISVTIEALEFSTFGTYGPYCEGYSPDVLPGTSNEGIVGTWSPAVISTTSVGTTSYTFTPDAALHPCGQQETISVTIEALELPTFPTYGPYCEGYSPDVLPGTSNEGIVGTWSPAVISTATVGTTSYTFTPDATLHPCGQQETISVTIEALELPTFPTYGPYCEGYSPDVLPGTSNEGIVGTWIPAVISTATVGTTSYTFTPDATLHPCGQQETISVTIEALEFPTFASFGPYCEGYSPDVLPGTSNEGIVGTWSPAVISTATVGTTSYTFTPDATLHPCGQQETISVTIEALELPTFPTYGPYCEGDSPDILPGTSNEGIVGTWIPAVISTASVGTISYTFTPDATLHPCGQQETISVTIEALEFPTFPSYGPYCEGYSPDVLPGTSNEGIVGTWSPAVISTASVGTTSYTFTPDATLHPCGQQETISVTIEALEFPTFPSYGPYCEGYSPDVLPGTSNEGIVGTWSPAVISTTSVGTTNYTFTPDATLHPCGQQETISVTIEALEFPTFASFGPYCEGDTPNVLPGTSNEGIVGTWSPAVISTASVGTTSYIFTPDAALHPCGQQETISVTIEALEFPTFGTYGPYCEGYSPDVLPGTSNEGIVGTWSPAVISTATVGTTSYTFTPDVTLHPCGQQETISVTIEALELPTFPNYGPYCDGVTPDVLPGTSNEGIVGTWSPAVISTTSVGTTNYTFTPDATLHPCGQQETISVTIEALEFPTFASFGPYCEGYTPDVLPGTSNEGIVGTWSPAVISTATVGTTSYTFTPDATLHPCGQQETISVTIEALEFPTFATYGPYCEGYTPDVLPGTSNEGIVGTWSPAVISTATVGTTSYTFTPDATLHPCGQHETISVTIEALEIPTFPNYGPYCDGVTPDVLPGTSNEGIVGTWSPAVISTATVGTTSYTFTPDVTLHPCGQQETISVTIEALEFPTFASFGPYCEGYTPDVLPGTSNEGIAGTWSPAVISTATVGTTSYTFTPDATLHPCGQQEMINVTIEALEFPTFASFGPYCEGVTPGVLPGISNEGIVGTWIPAVISTATVGTTSYTFTPDATLHPCGQQETISVTIEALEIPTFPSYGPYCEGVTSDVLPGTSNEGIVGTWSPAVISTTTVGTTSYTFTPDAALHPCGQQETISVIIEALEFPTFASFGPYCEGYSPDVLPGTSNEGIVGTWSPAVISTTTVGTTSYIFTPDAALHPCGQQETISVTIEALEFSTFPNFGPYCEGDVADVLPGVSVEGIIGVWTPGSISTSTAGTTSYTFTPDATLHPCGQEEIINIRVDALELPTFANFGPYCVGDIPDVLPNFSIESIAGIWNPSTISTATVGTTSYTFTPDATLHPCGQQETINITIEALEFPTFASYGPYCEGSSPDVLPGISNEGIVGTWTPTVINTTTIGTTNYTFTPDATIHPCGQEETISVTIEALEIPTFPNYGPYCEGSSPDVLPGISNEGIIGFWTPAVINTTTVGTTSYTFTPDATLHPCGQEETINITVEALEFPTFDNYGPYCEGDMADPLPTFSNEGISGTWTPAVISTASVGTTSYTFTPDPILHPCGQIETFSVTVDALEFPTFTTYGPYCEGATPDDLPLFSNEGIIGTWSPSAIVTTSPGTTSYTFIPNVAVHPCGEELTINITVNTAELPTFPMYGPYCVGDNPALLPGISNEGIVGTWTPAVISTASVGTTSYTFIPDATLHPCGQQETISITVEALEFPTFTTYGPYCEGATPALLATTSNEGIVGAWAPAVISTTTVGTTNYTFTPDATLHPCGQQETISVTIEALEISTFPSYGPYCQGASPDVLPQISNEGIMGTWTPATINTSLFGTNTYTFTPDAVLHPCGQELAISITVNPLEPTTFAAFGPYCVGDTPDVLPTVSNEGIAGTWMPSVISTASSGTNTYVFTPDNIQHPCAQALSIAIEVYALELPTFVSFGPYCEGATPALLPTTSNEGILGTWTPALISTSTVGTNTYTFSPNATLHPCGQEEIISITIDPLERPTFSSYGPYCEGATPALLPTTSNEGILGTWTPAVISTTAAGTTNYTFTPDATLHPCGQEETINITVEALEFPTFSSYGPYCESASPDVLPGISNEGIVGTWTPAVISTASIGTTNYTFTPDATLHPCGQEETISIIIDSLEFPTFSSYGPYCEGSTADVLPNTSIEGISGIWTPAMILTNTPGINTYTFTPDPVLHPCGQPEALNLEVFSNIIVDPIDFECAIDLSTYNLTIAISGGSGNYTTVTAGAYNVLDNGGGLYTVEGIPSGIGVTIEVIDNNGCLINFSTIPQDCNCPVIPPATGAQDQTYCFGDAPSALSVTDPGSGYQVNWYDSGNTFLSNDNPYTPTGPGTYSVTIEELSSGCESNSVSVVLTEYPALEIIELDYTCAPNLLTYDLSITVSGGSGVYTSVVAGSLTVVDNGSGNYTIEGIASGTGVLIELTDDAGCMTTLTTTPQDCDCPVIPPATGAQDQTYCFGDAPSALSVTDPGAGYQVNWYLGGTFLSNDNPYTPAGPGTYQVTIEELSSGCESTPVTVVLSGNPALQIVQLDYTCAMDLLTYDLSITVSGGSGVYTSVVAGSLTVVENGSGNYTIEGIASGTGVLIELTDDAGCMTTLTTTPQDCDCPVIPPATGAQDQSYCFGDPPSALSVTDPGAGYQVNWYLGGTFLSNDNPYTPAGPGTYQVTIEELSSGCESTPVTVVLSENPALQIVQLDYTCAIDLLTYDLSISVSGGSGVYTSVVAGSLTVVDNGSGNYTIEGIASGTGVLIELTDDAGCTTTLTTTPQDCDCPVIPPATGAQDQTYCFGDAPSALSVTDPGAGYQVNWYGSGNTFLSNDNPYTPAGPGTYQVTIEELSSGCESTPVTVVLSENPALQIVQLDYTCAIDLLTYDLSITVSGGSGVYTSVVAGGLMVVDNGSGNYTIEGIASGTGVLIELTDDAGCTTTLTTTPQDCDCPVIPPATGAQDQSYCFGDSPTALSVTDPGAGYQVNWYGSGNTFLSNDNPYTPAGPGTYQVTIEELSSGCESTPVTVVLSENPALQIVQLDYTCAIDLLTYDLSITVSGGSGVYTSVVAGGLMVVDNGSGNYTIEGIASGTGVLIELTDDAGCTTTLTTTPQDCDCPVIPPATGAQDQSYCFGDSPTALSVTDPGAGYQMNWYLGGTFLSNDNPYTPAGPGTYQVTIEELSSGCESTPVTVVLSENPALQIVQLDYTCAMDLLTYDLAVSVSGGSGVYTSVVASSLTVVDNGSGNYTIEGITSGTGVLIELTDDAGCMTTLTTTPQDCNCPVIPPATGAQDQSYCFGDSPSALSVTDPGAAYQVNWYLGSTFLSNDNPYIPAGPGTYQVTIEELSSGCESTPVTVVLSENPALQIVQLDYTCAMDLLTYDLSISVSGGSGVYTSVVAGSLTVVDNGSGNYTIENIASGTGVLIELTDDAGCMTTLTTTPQDCDCPGLSIPTNPVDAIICFGENPVALSVDAPGVGFDINWYDSPSGGILLATGPSFIPLSPGIYYAETIEMTNNCVSDRIPVTLSEHPEIDFIVASEICTNELSAYDLIIDISGGTAPYQVDAGALLVIENSVNNFTIQQVSGAGGVLVNITDNTGCTYSRQAIPGLLIAPIAGAGMPQFLSCEDTIVILQASGSDIDSYQWEGPGTFTSNLQNPMVDVAGIYLLIATNANGCIDSAQTTIIYDDSVPLANAGMDRVITCKEECVILQGSANTSNVTYSWTGPDPGMITDIANPTVCVPGEYQLVVSNNNSCISPPSTVTVIDGRDTLEAVIIADPQVNSLSCTVNSITLSGTNSNIGSNGIYIWESDSDIIYSPSIEVSEPGMYTLTVIDTLSECLDSAQFIVGSSVDYPLIIFDQPTLLTCTNDTVFLDATDSGLANPSTVEYQWAAVFALDTLPIPGATSLVLASTSPGWYCLTAIDPVNGCTNVECVELLGDLTLPLVDAGTDERLDCETFETTLNGTTDVINATLNWTPVSGIINGANTFTPLVNREGIYYLNVTKTDNGCSALDSVKVLGPETPMPQIQIDPITCAGENDATVLVEDVLGGEAPYVFSIDGGNTFNDLNQFTNLGSGNYNLIVQDVTGCEHEEPFSILDATPIVLNLESNVEISLGESYQIQTQTNVSPARMDTLWWTPMDSLSCSDCLEPLANPAFSTDYQLTVVDTNGCQAEARINILVDRQLEIFVPNIFSPNGDGVNDLFTIYTGEGVEKIETMQIFDRWGELIFVQKNIIPNDPEGGWDGRFRGEPMNPAVFVYFAKIKMKDGRTELIEGDVLLSKIEAKEPNTAFKE